VDRDKVLCFKLALGLEERGIPVQEGEYKCGHVADIKRFCHHGRRFRHTQAIPITDHPGKQPDLLEDLHILQCAKRDEIGASTSTTETYDQLIRAILRVR
jgi:hypothetical protein